VDLLLVCMCNACDAGCPFDTVSMCMFLCERRTTGHLHARSHVDEAVTRRGGVEPVLANEPCKLPRVNSWRI